MTSQRFSSGPRLGVLASLLLYSVQFASAQLNQNCTVSVLNRSVQVNPDGSWVLPNIPANIGQVKARATCVQNGLTISGESAFFVVNANTAVNLPAITLGSGSQVPASLLLTPANPAFSNLGQTMQLTVTASYPDATTKNVTAASTGTNYTTSNPAIVSVSPNGLITAVSSGTVVIQATNDGTPAILLAKVVLSNLDSDGDGIPDDVEIANGLNPKNPVDAQEDFDRDGLTNANEILQGTNLHKADTDGDGLTDGDEVNKYGTKPLLADTDGDKIPDGIEIATGTNPQSAASYDLRKAIASSSLTPSTFALTTTTVDPNPTVQLTWKVTLLDSKTVLDLTADPRTVFTSSDLTICNFSNQKGMVFAGNGGTCVVTVHQSTLSDSASGTVNSFTPSEVSSLDVPGAVAVDVSGRFAYIAAGLSGLVIVDLGDRTNSVIRSTLGGLGNAAAVRVAGQNVLVADSTGFVRIVEVTNPSSPALRSSLAIPGIPSSLAVRANTVAVAAQSGGVAFVDISVPTSPNLLSTVTTASPAVGVDLDLQRNLAAVAMRTGGMQLINIANLRSPQLRGVLAGGDVRQVLLRYPAVLLADTARSVSAANISNPGQPVLTSSTRADLGGAPVDIAAFGTTAITADISFGRVVPVLNIADPLTPTPLLFWTLGSPGFGSSIGVDNSFGYLILPNIMRIFKYQDISDSLGVPPTVTITSPASNSTLIQGQTVVLTATAVDDIGVVSVSFLVNGQVIGTTSSTPYQFTYIVPASATLLTFGATAVDYGNNIGTAHNTQLQVVPDPLTTITGRVIDGAGNPVAGATVTALTRTATTPAGGTFTLSGLPTIRGPIVVTAVGTVRGVLLGGFSASLSPLPSSVVNAGDIKIVPKPFITSISPTSAIAGTSASVTLTGTNLAGSTFAFDRVGILVSPASIDTTGSTATFAASVGGDANGRFTVIATNPAGSSNPTPVVGFVRSSPAFNTISVPGSDPNGDADNDGLKNGLEIGAGTDPLNPDTDADSAPDGLEVLLNSDPRDRVSLPRQRSSGWLSGSIFSVLNNVNPSGPITGTNQYVSGLVFSVLNRLNPSTGASGLSQYVSGLTFSILNSLNPATGVAGSTQYVSGLTFSMLNRLNPSTGVTGSSQYLSSLTYSIRNNLNPATGIAGSPQYVSGLTFSMLNRLNPALAASEPTTIRGRFFSISNTVSGGNSMLSLFDPVTIANRVTNPASLPSEALPVRDSDGDGISDNDEIHLGTNPFDNDSDHDGYPDGLEVALGANPLESRSTPNVRPSGFALSPYISIQNYAPQAKNSRPDQPVIARRQR